MKINFTRLGGTTFFFSRSGKSLCVAKLVRSKEFFSGVSKEVLLVFFETPNPVIIKKIASKHKKSKNGSGNIHGLQMKLEEK